MRRHCQGFSDDGYRTGDIMTRECCLRSDMGDAISEAIRLWAPVCGLKKGGSAMRIEQLIAFDKVVQHSSFTKAANELYTTQPSVSKMIDALEDELGHQLLRRTSRASSSPPMASGFTGTCADHSS